MRAGIYSEFASKISKVDAIAELAELIANNVHRLLGCKCLFTEIELVDAPHTGAPKKTAVFYNNFDTAALKLGLIRFDQIVA